MKRAALAAAVLLLGAGSALFVFSAEPALPPGFHTIRSAPAFQDPVMLERAWALPVARLFPRPLITQSNPSACGPTSIANVLHSTGSTTSSSEVASHGTGCLAGFCFGGVTLAELGALTLASTGEWKVSELRPETVEAFREELRHANEPERRLIINFTRLPLFGKGGGHHSPIGGYLEAEDLVFVLDVNERFRPWLVSSARLFEAMDTVDSSSRQKRGLLRLTK